MWFKVFFCENRQALNRGESRLNLLHSNHVWFVPFDNHSGYKLPPPCQIRSIYRPSLVSAYVKQVMKYRIRRMETEVQTGQHKSLSTKIPGRSEILFQFEIKVQVAIVWADKLGMDVAQVYWGSSCPRRPRTSANCRLTLRSCYSTSLFTVWTPQQKGNIATVKVIKKVSKDIIRRRKLENVIYKTVQI